MRNLNKEDAENKKVKLFLCESGNCLERQIMKDLPWDEIQTIINCPQDGFPYQNIQLPEVFEEKIKGASDAETKDEIRSEIVALAIKKNKEWFKHIPGGEFLGTVFCDSYDNIDSNACLKQNINSLLNWCNIL